MTVVWPKYRRTEGEFDIIIAPSHATGSGRCVGWCSFIVMRLFSSLHARPYSRRRLARAGSRCHPWVRTINISLQVPSLETSCYSIVTPLRVTFTVICQACTEWVRLPEEQKLGKYHFLRKRCDITKNKTHSESGEGPMVGCEPLRQHAVQSVPQCEPSSNVSLTRCLPTTIEQGGS